MAQLQRSLSNTFKKILLFVILAEVSVIAVIEYFLLKCLSFTSAEFSLDEFSGREPIVFTVSDYQNIKICL